MLARIPRHVPKGRRKLNQRRALSHLAFVRAIGICVACGAQQGRCEAAHIRSRTDGGMGIKPSDRFSVPLCQECHARQHRCGEQTFWGELGIDPLDIACRLWTVSGDLGAGERCVRRARQVIELRKLGR